MNHLSAIFTCFMLTTFVSTSLASDGSQQSRAQHQELKRFLDCERAGGKDCQLEKPSKRDQNPSVEHTDSQDKIERKRPTPSQQFISQPSRRGKKSKGSAR